MVLVDTSVWVDHLRRGNRTLAELLERATVVCHPLVIGELACGTLTRRAEVLRLLEKLPTTLEAGHREVMTFIDAQGLAGQGIGFIDAHLLASARLGSISLWTLDKRLHRQAERLGCAHLSGTR